MAFVGAEKFLEFYITLHYTWVGKSRGWKEDRQVGTGRGWGKEWRGTRMAEGQSGERIREEGVEGGGVQSRDMWVGEGKKSVMGYRIHVAGAQVWEGRWERKENWRKGPPEFFTLYRFRTGSTAILTILAIISNYQYELIPVDNCSLLKLIIVSNNN